MNSRKLKTITKKSVPESENNKSIHYPVMLQEMLYYLKPTSGETYLDATFGGGGYSKAILETIDCKLFGIDRDPNAKSFASHIQKEYPNNFYFNQSDFATYVANCESNKFDAVIMDLGTSMMQLEDSERGFSFQKDGPLDMRMDREGKDAYQIINNESQEAIADILYNFGGERASRKIASAIIKAREVKSIETTIELAGIIRKALNNKYSKIDLATRSFQALRIYVNDELEQIRLFLSKMQDILKPKARIIIVSFHSLEDKIVKDFFKENSDKKIARSKYAPKNTSYTEKWLEIITKKPITPSKEEILKNNPSRSAKMRVAIKKDKIT